MRPFLENNRSPPQKPTLKTALSFATVISDALSRFPKYFKAVLYLISDLTKDATGGICILS